MVSGCRLTAGVFGRKDWCLGQQAGRSGAWVHGTRLHPVFTWVGLVFDSVVMGLEHMSSWVDIDSGPSGINQMLGTTGMNHFLDMRELVHYWDGESLVTVADLDALTT